MVWWYTIPLQLAKAELLGDCHSTIVFIDFVTFQQWFANGNIIRFLKFVLAITPVTSTYRFFFCIQLSLVWITSITVQSIQCAQYVQNLWFLLYYRYFRQFAFEKVVHAWHKNCRNGIDDTKIVHNWQLWYQDYKHYSYYNSY